MKKLFVAQNHLQCKKIKLTTHTARKKLGKFYLIGKLHSYLNPGKECPLIKFQALKSHYLNDFRNLFENNVWGGMWKYSFLL